MMQSIKLYLGLALIVAFLAGLATGRLRFGAGPDDEADRGRRGPRDPASRMCDELGLDGEQRQKVLEIWSQALREVPPPPIEDLRAIEEQRKSAVVALLTPEQKAAYEKLNADLDARIEKLHAPARAAFQRANDKTRELLNDEQKQKFEAMFGGKDGNSRDGWRGYPFGRRGGSSTKRE